MVQAASHKRGVRGSSADSSCSDFAKVDGAPLSSCHPPIGYSRTICLQASLASGLASNWILYPMAPNRSARVRSVIFCSPLRHCVTKALVLPIRLARSALVMPIWSIVEASNSVASRISSSCRRSFWSTSRKSCEVIILVPCLKLGSVRSFVLAFDALRAVNVGRIQAITFLLDSVGDYKLASSDEAKHSYLKTLELKQIIGNFLKFFTVAYESVLRKSVEECE